MPDRPVALRALEDADLDVFFEQQQDPEARHMAAFTAADPRDRAAFDAHWDRLRSDPRVEIRTVLHAGRVAGHLIRFPQDGQLEVTYWIGREHWGKRIATRALEELLRELPERPVRARVVHDNVASLRVLEKCGFRAVGRDRGFANARGEDVDERILRLD